MPPIEFPDEGISDGEIAIRPHRPADIPGMVEACQDPSIPQFTRVPEPYTEDDAREWISFAAAGRMDGSRLSLAIAEPEGALLGSIGLHAIEWDQARGELGYWVAPWARGRGVATKAVELISSYAFETLGMERLTIHAEPRNEVSRRVAEAAGFKPEGLIRGWLVQSGRRRDVISHGRLRSDHPNRPRHGEVR